MKKFLDCFIRYPLCGSFTVAAALIAFSSLLQRHFFFRDYSIVWEGAYRISLGQLPYLDFGIPVGPVAFILPALFFVILGPSFLVLKFVAFMTNLLGLLSFLLFLKEFKVSQLVLWAGALGFAILHAMETKYPWYNTVASSISFVALWLFARAMRKEKKIFTLNMVLLNGILAAAAAFCVFLSKQDFGILLTLILFGHALLLLLLPNSRNQAAAFIFSLGLMFVLFFIAFRFSKLGYWFNLGQYPHAVRSETFPFSKWLSEPSGIRTALILVAGLGVVTLFQKKQRLSDALLGDLLFYGLLFGIVLMSSITWYSSGLPFCTGFYGLATVPAVVCHSVSRALPSLWSKFWAMKVCQLAVMTALISIFLYDFKLHERPTFKDLRVYFKDSGITDYSSSRVGKRASPADAQSLYSDLAQSQTPISGTGVEGLVSGRDAGLPAFGNEYMKAASWAQIKQFVTAFSSRLRSENEAAFGNSCRFLNISELTPLFAELGLRPCTGLPLWYHTGISLFPPEQRRILEGVANKSFKVVVAQKTHEWDSQWYVRLFALLEQHYVKKYSFFAAATHDPVRIFVRPEDQL